MRRAILMLSVVAAALVALLASAGGARAQTPAEAKGPPLSVAVFLSSRTDACHDPGVSAAIRRFTALEAARINRQGGIGGRPLELRYLDDRQAEARLVENVDTALADPVLLAMVGVANSNRAKALFAARGKTISESGVPFVSDISITSIFEAHPNVFTSRSSQDEERLPVMLAFMRQIGFQRPGFLGLKDAVFSASLGDGLVKALGERALQPDVRLSLADDKLDPQEIAAAVTGLKISNPDLLFLSVGTARTPALLEAMMKEGVTPPLFISGRIDALPAALVASYPNDFYQLAWDELPDVYNDRLRRLIATDAPEAWVFEGAKIASAPGWAKGECKARPEGAPADPLAPDNLRAIAAGTQYADMVALVAAAANAAPRDADLVKRRARVIAELRTAFATGRGTFKGSFENWSFDPGSRSASRTPFVVMLPRGLGRTQLASTQFVRLRGGALKPMATLYLDVDMIRAHAIDDNEKTFLAEFYLSMRSEAEAEIADVEFTNAYLDPRTNGRQITVTPLHDGRPSEAYPEKLKIYRIAGKFLFNPDLAQYPFDTQRFSIDIQPKRSEAPFIVQPPPASLRDQRLITDGWEAHQQYVGYDEDFVPVVDPYTHAPSVVPFYKASFVWIMQRQTTDYFLRVVVPLAFILIVAYVSIFIPLSHFEAIVTIQVTALLSAVALYLSLPKLDSDTATLSDTIFVFDYMMVSLMIVISILRMNGAVTRRPWLGGILTATHVAAIPAIVALAALYLARLAQSGSV